MTAAQWTAVGERLPDADLLVLIALNDDDVWTGFVDADGWHYSDAMPIKAERVTHWMHLPAPPAFTCSGSSSRESASPAAT